MYLFRLSNDNYQNRISIFLNTNNVKERLEILSTFPLKEQKRLVSLYETFYV